MDDVHRVGQEISAHYEHINVLINNAGIHAFEQHITKDGFPEMMAINYFALWLLMHALIDALICARSSQVVNVASEASRRHGVLNLPNNLVKTAPFGMLGSFPIYGRPSFLTLCSASSWHKNLPI
jgi:NAD(P)-dependent dehydrogenase (short-subunit alcohol dehydrogenase family)